MNEQQKIEEAKNCDNCLCWHKHCKAECCYMMYITDEAKQMENSSNYIYINRAKGVALAYYFMRGIKLIHGKLRVEKRFMKKDGDKYIYWNKCIMLGEDLLCKGHPDHKPPVCRVLTLETASKKDVAFNITPNCLFKYKENIQ